MRGRGILAAVVLIAGVAYGRPDDDAAKKEMAKMEGDWTLASGERDGMPIPEEFAKTMRRTIKGEEFTVTREGETIVKGKFTIDPTKKPKTIDVTFTDGQLKDKSTLGIYELEGDTFKLCYAAPDSKERPKEFSAKEGSGHTLAVWKRQK